MKTYVRQNAFQLLSAAVVIALFCAGAFPDPSLAGVGMAMSVMISDPDFLEIKKTLNEQGEAWRDFRKRYDARVDKLEKDVETEFARLNRPRVDGLGAGGATAPKSPQFYDQKSGKPVLVLRHGESLAEHAPRGEGEAEIKGGFNVGRVLRGIVMGGRADDAKQLAEERKALNIGTDPAGGYSVQGWLLDEWIDLLRSRMVLSQAGALTLPMEEGKVSICRVTADPTVGWHGENADLSDGDPTFGAVSLSAKTVYCLVRFSVELAQDSKNIDQMLERTITAAIAQAIDSAGLVGVTTNAAAAPLGIMNLTGRNSVTSIGAPTSWDFLVDGMYELAVDNVPMESIGAFIAHPAVWKKMRKLKTGISSDNTPLTMPEEVARLPKLWTTAAPLTGGTTAKGIIGKWDDLLFGVRQQLNVRLLDQAFMGANLQLALLATARVDFAATRATSFCTLEGITV